MTIIHVGDYIIHSMFDSWTGRFMGWVTYKGSKIENYKYSGLEKGILDWAYQAIKDHKESVEKLNSLGR